MPKGFTLIEVLVALTILALVAVLSIPNFKRFNQDQTLINSVQDLSTALKTAQTNAQTGVLCPNDKSTAQFWAVTLLQRSYYVWANCSVTNSTNPAQVLNTINLASSSLSINDPTIVASPEDAPSSCYIQFSGNAISESSNCKDPSGNSDTRLSGGKLEIQIDNSGAIYKCIQISKGGAISVHDPVSTTSPTASCS